MEKPIGISICNSLIVSDNIPSPTLIHPPSLLSSLSLYISPRFEAPINRSGSRYFPNYSCHFPFLHFLPNNHGLSLLLSLSMSPRFRWDRCCYLYRSSQRLEWAKRFHCKLSVEATSCIELRLFPLLHGTRSNEKQGLKVYLGRRCVSDYDDTHSFDGKRSENSSNRSTTIDCIHQHAAYLGQVKGL